MTSGPIDRSPGRPGFDKNRWYRPSLFGLKQRMTSCLVLAENIVEGNIYCNIYLEENIVRTDKAKFVAEVCVWKYISPSKCKMYWSDGGVQSFVLCRLVWIHSEAICWVKLRCPLLQVLTQKKEVRPIVLLFQTLCLTCFLALKANLGLIFGLVTTCFNIEFAKGQKLMQKQFPTALRRNNLWHIIQTWRWIDQFTELFVAKYPLAKLCGEY